MCYSCYKLVGNFNLLLIHLCIPSVGICSNNKNTFLRNDEPLWFCGLLIRQWEGALALGTAISGINLETGSAAQWDIANHIPVGLKIHLRVFLDSKVSQKLESKNIHKTYGFPTKNIMFFSPFFGTTSSSPPARCVFPSLESPSQPRRNQADPTGGRPGESHHFLLKATRISKKNTVSQSDFWPWLSWVSETSWNSLFWVVNDEWNWMNIPSLPTFSTLAALWAQLTGRFGTSTKNLHGRVQDITDLLVWDHQFETDDAWNIGRFWAHPRSYDLNRSSSQQGDPAIAQGGPGRGTASTGSNGAGTSWRWRDGFCFTILGIYSELAWVLPSVSTSTQNSRTWKSRTIRSTIHSTFSDMNWAGTL